MKWVVRTSTVRISTRESDRVYRSLDEVPEESRDTVRKCLEGPNAQTILIANPEAYERIAEGVRDLPEEMRRLEPRILSHKRHAARTKFRRQRGSDMEWKIALVGGSLLILSLWGLWLWAIRIGM
jgi:hypothetical protein